MLLGGRQLQSCTIITKQRQAICFTYLYIFQIKEDGSETQLG